MIPLRQYEAGETILKENEMGETAYIIEHGKVEVTKKSNGKELHIAYIGAGETFGEMGMIDEKPRSATVKAVEKTMVKEVHRDNFLESLQSDPDVAVSILSVLFERLRESHSKILQFQQTGMVPAPAVSKAPVEPPQPSGLSISMEGLTPAAVQSLPGSPYQISSFPFLIGRKSRDPFSYNDLKIPDSAPLQISRHHLEFIVRDDRVGVSDRGSYLGSIVDEKMLGGKDGSAGPLYFQGNEGILVIGNSKSPFKYKIRIHQPE